MQMLTLLFALAPAVGHAATSPLAPAAPACDAELAWITDYARRNYAGFEIKTAGAAGARYEALLAELRPGAAAAPTTAACDALIARWIDFFEDGHIWIRRAADPRSSNVAIPAETDDAIRARLAGRERLELSEEEARARIAARGAERSPLEGIWELGDAYRVAVVRDERPGRHYTMTTLRADSVWWIPGQVKATFAETGTGGYDVRFYMRDHSEQAWTGRVARNVLLMSQGSPWIRVWPAVSGDLTPEQYAATQNRRFAARELATGTVLVQIPSFGDPRGVDSLFAAERRRIRAADRLIVDLRGNGGGSDYNFRHLVPLIYTNPIRVVGMLALATDDNLRAHEALLSDPEIPAAQRARIRSRIARMATARGGWYEFPDDVVRHRRVLRRPSRVDILVDRGCASSCEQFVLAARQSRKVTLYGDRTAGILDFGNVRAARMPGGTLSLHYPTTRSRRLPHDPVDPHGIQPDVRIPADELDAVGWVLRQADGAASGVR
jgi:hypothetical protein